MKLSYISKYFILTALICNTIFTVFTFHFFMQGQLSITHLLICLLNEISLFALERLSETNIEIQKLHIEIQENLKNAQNKFINSLLFVIEKESIDMNKFKVEEKIFLNGEIKQETFDEYGDYADCYNDVKQRITKYTKDILDTREVEALVINGNGTEFIIQNSYFVDNELNNEEILINIIDLTEKE